MSLFEATRKLKTNASTAGAGGGVAEFTSCALFSVPVFSRDRTLNRVHIGATAPKASTPGVETPERMPGSGT